MRLLISAGGTGGDLFPATAVAEELRNFDPDLSVHLAGNPNRIEAKAAPSLGYQFHGLSVRGFKGLRAPETLLLPFQIASSWIKSHYLLAKFNIDGVVCGGTYISYPVGIAASQRGIPMILLESNALPGKTNRALARRASNIMLAFDESRHYFPDSVQHKLTTTGNPVRKSFSGAPPDRQAARRMLSLDNESRPVVFFFGGSLGARSINKAVEALLSDERTKNIDIIWQTGRQEIGNISLPNNVRRFVFIDDMATIYAASDLIVCRSGGGTVAELAAAGKPAILIPLPSAANNEQMYNARIIEKRGAAVVLDDALAVSNLPDTLFGLLNTPERIQSMAQNSRLFASPNAARTAAERLWNLMNERKRT